MKNKIELKRFYEWYSILVFKYYKPIVSVFVLISLSLPIITFFICPIPAIEDIREEFVVRGTKASGKTLQFYNLKSLSTRKIALIAKNSSKTLLRQKHSVNENEYNKENTGNENTKTCSDYLFNFKYSKRIIVHMKVPSKTNKNQYATYEEILNLCIIENEIKSTFTEDTVTVITKAEAYRRILKKPQCIQITLNDVSLANQMIQNLTEKLMEKENKYSFSNIDCWIMRFLYYIIPLSSSNLIQMDYPGVSMIFFDLTESDMYRIGSVYNILSKRNFQIIGTKTQNENEIVQEILKSDLSKEIYILIIILILLYFCSRSILLTLFTFFIMSNAILLSYIIYVHVFNIITFPFINFMSFIILLALGADDIIIYTLTWNKIQRLNIGDNIKILKTIESSLPTIFATSFSTALSLLFCFTSSIVAIKCFSCYGALLISIHFLFVFLFLPSLCYINCSKNSSKTDMFNLNYHFNFHEFCQRFIFDKFANLITNQIIKFYKIIFSICLTLFILSIISLLFYPKLVYPENLKNDILKLSHPNLFYNVIKNKFTFERHNYFVRETKWIVNLVWGVKDDDNRSWLNLRQYSAISIDRNFNITDPKTIKWLVRFCEIINNNFDTPNEIKNFIRYRKEKQLTNCPFDNGIASVKQFIDQNNCTLDTNIDNGIANCINRFNEIDNSENNFQFHYQDETIVGMIISFPLNISSNQSYHEIILAFQLIDNWFDSLLKSSPLSLKHGFTVFQSEKESIFLVYSAIAEYLPMSFGLAFVSAGLVGVSVVWNWRLMGLMLVDLMFVVSMSIGSLVWLDWKIGIVEAAIFTIATGLGIDFCLHFAIAVERKRNKSIDSMSRARIALEEIFWPVILTAVTTGLPGAPLVGSELVIFYRLGTFLFVVTVWSLVGVMLMFPAGVLVFEWCMSCGQVCADRSGVVQY